MLPLHDQGRGPWILLHVVSGPWTSFVAALDKGQCRKAVCRRHTVRDITAGDGTNANLFYSVKVAPYLMCRYKRCDTGKLPIAEVVRSLQEQQPANILTNEA
jgi:hypothetical protein